MLKGDGKAMERRRKGDGKEVEERLEERHRCCGNRIRSITERCDVQIRTS